MGMQRLSPFAAPYSVCVTSQVCLVINSALGAGLSWDDIGAMVATETAAGTIRCEV